MKLHLATEHAGLDLKNSIKNYLLQKEYFVEDHGAYEYDAEDDYPDFIFPCAKAVADDEESRGIILGGSGQGEAMAANRIKGCRAAVFYSGPKEIVTLSREHNNANILSLGARFMNENDIFDVIAGLLVGVVSGKWFLDNLFSKLVARDIKVLDFTEYLKESE